MEKIGIKYGLFTAAGLAVYFMLMHLLGFSNILELRLLNGVIMAVGVVMAIRAYKKVKEGQIGYFKGIGVGMITAILATVLFSTSMLIYVKAFDTGLLEVLSAERYFGERMRITPGIVVFSVLMLEGVISGFMIAFISMQWFKRRDHKVPGSP